MNSTESESRQASDEARRDILSRGAHPNTGARYDAVLRYLRGLYVRTPKTSPEQKQPARPQAGPGTGATTPAGPKPEPPDSAKSTHRQADQGS